MSESKTTKTETIQNPRLLLVDDEPGLRTAVPTYLQDEGFEVTTAIDGEDGWNGIPKRL